MGSTEPGGFSLERMCRLFVGTSIALCVYMFVFSTCSLLFTHMRDWQRLGSFIDTRYAFVELRPVYFLLDSGFC